MIQKKHYLFFLCIFIQLFGMDDPKVSCHLLEQPKEIYKKIAGSYLSNNSIRSLMLTCRLLHTSLSSIFIKNQDGKCVTGKYGEIIRCIIAAKEYYRDNFDLCSSALSFFAQQRVSNGEDKDSKASFEYLYNLHPNERNAGIMAVLDIPEKPSIEDCIRVYSGDCRRQSDHGVLHNGILLLYKKSAKCVFESSYGQRWSLFFADSNIQAINTMFLDNILCDNEYANTFVQMLCFFDDYNIKNFLRYAGFYCMPSLVSSRDTDSIQIRKNILIKTFASIIESKKEDFVDIICENIEPNNSGLFFLLWMHNLVYNQYGQHRNETAFIKKFISTKKIDLNEPDEHGERTSDYVYSRAKKLYHPHTTIAQLSELGCKIDAADCSGKTLLQKAGEKYYKSLLHNVKIDCDLDTRELVNVLLQNKINQLKKIKEIDKPIDDYGNTVLHYAAMFRLNGVMYQAITSGANINAQNVTGMTPFFIACLVLYNISHEQVWNKNGESFSLSIEILCQYYVDVNKTDSNNRLPFLIVCDALRCFLNKMTCPSARGNFMYNDCMRIMKQFSECGADINMRNSDGKFAYDGLDIEVKVKEYLLSKMSYKPFFAYCAISALCAYGLFKYFQDK